jgi:tetratricopeptide (TPR) repeat protein
MTQKRIFLSHRSSQKAFLKERFIPKLKPTFKVWLDEREIDPLTPISEKVRQAIAASHLFLAWWFDGYEESEPCHFELITALAHCRADGEHSHQQRVFFAGPDAARDYAEAGIFKGLLAAPLSAEPTEDELDGLVKALIERAEKIDSTRPFGATKLDAASRAAIIPNTNFVGRAKELLQLFGRMYAGRAGTEGGGDAVTLVSGIGGEGKTELAKEFARRFRAWYPGGVYRINLPGDSGDRTESEAALNQALRGIADDLGLTLPENASRRFVRGRLAEAEKLTRPYLWLLDDIRGGVKAEDLEEFLPPNAHGTSLLTSRAKIDGLPEFDLERLSPSDGLRLLKQLCQTLTNDVAAKLVDHVKGHALALNLIGRGVHSGTDPATFLSETGAALVPLEQVAEHLNLGEASVRPVLATLLTSLNLIPADHSARSLLGLMAHLAPDPVPVAFLGQFIPEKERVSGLELLKNRGFLREPVIAGEPCRRLHPLLAEVVRALGDGFGSVSEISGWLEAADKVLAADLRAIYEDAGHFRRFPLSPLLLPHCRHRAIIGLKLNKAELAAWVGSALHALGDYPNARYFHEGACKVNAVRLELADPYRLGCLTSLANTMRAQGDFISAWKLHRLVFRCCLLRTDQDLREILIRRSELALTLFLIGKFNIARWHQEVILLNCEGKFDENDDMRLTSMHNLANTLRVLGETDRAFNLHNNVFYISKETLGELHIETIISSHNLALTYRAKRDLANSLRLQHSAMDNAKNCLWTDHPVTIKILNSLSLIYLDKLMIREAEKLSLDISKIVDLSIEKYLDIYISSKINSVLINIQINGYNDGKIYWKSFLLWRRAFFKRKDDYNTSSIPAIVDSLISLNRLAVRYFVKGDVVSAIALHKRALKARRRILGIRHPDTLTSVYNLARAQLAHKKVNAAFDLIKPIVPLLAGLNHELLKKQLTALARHLDLLPPEAP